MDAGNDKMDSGPAIGGPTVDVPPGKTPEEVMPPSKVVPPIRLSNWSPGSSASSASLNGYEQNVVGKGKQNFEALLGSIKDRTAGLPGFSGKMGSLAAFEKILWNEGAPTFREGGRGLLNQTVRAGQIVAGMFPQIDSIGGWRGNDDYRFHPGGSALDIMMPNDGHTRGDVELGNKIAMYFMKTAKANHVSYMLWRQRQWSAGEGVKHPSSWRGMEGRGGWTANHMDHIHLNLTESQIPMNKLGMVPGATTKKEAMKKWDGSLWSLINAHPENAVGRGGAGGGGKGGGADTSVYGNAFGGGGAAYPVPRGIEPESPNSHHDGQVEQDISGPQGTPIYSMFDGKITQMWRPIINTDGSIGSTAGGGYGNHIYVVSRDGHWEARYAHLRAGKPYVKGLHEGSMVSAGQQIGYMGSTGSSSGPHLHLELYRNGGRRYPLAALAKRGVKPAMFAEGGVVTDDTLARIGEAGDKEAVIPLNRMGVSVIADAIAQYSHTYEARASRTAGRGVVINAPVTYHQDHSTRITGPITVKTSNVGEFARQMQQRARRNRLVNPVGSQ